jgi:plasmid stabilization system protein ParE
VPKITYTNAARADLMEAWMFVAEESLYAADKLLDAIEESITFLAQQPLMGRGRPELRANLRSWPTTTPYILFYVPESDGLTLIRVLHHAQDVQSINMSQ